jgi:hypothetical protein
MHCGFYRRDVRDAKDFGGRRPPLQFAADRFGEVRAGGSEDVIGDR